MKSKYSHQKISMILTQTYERVKKKKVRSAEVGALDTVFKKSVAKLKQKLLKFKSTIKIVTFNVRTLNRIGQLPELTASVIDHRYHLYGKTLSTP